MEAGATEKASRPAGRLMNKLMQQRADSIAILVGHDGKAMLEDTDACIDAARASLKEVSEDLRRFRCCL